MVILSLLFALGGLMTTVAAGSSSFGGVNHYFLASLDPTTRDQVIDFAVAGGAKVIRTFVRPETNGMEKGDSKNTWPDVESPMGKFVNPLASILDNYDDMLYSIYKSNSGNTKVILSLHDANMLPPNPFTQPCDAYCTYMKENNMPWQSFYTDGTIRNAFKTRLNNILNNYPSKNFGGRPWSQLSEIILSIDLENEPGVANPTYPLGGWICDIASYLKNNVGLQGIGVSTGGIGGSDSGDVPPATSGQNWPDEVFTCAAIDIISLHGYYKESGSSSAGQPWCDLLSPNGVLVPKALNNGKLLMAEEWVYNGGPGSKNGDIQTQAHALNALGIPWSYWDIMSGSETCSTCGNNEVSVDDSSNGAAFFTLSNMMYEASITTTVFDWSRFFPTNPNAKPITDGTCGPGPSPSPPGQPGCHTLARQVISIFYRM
ncbi:hypothetical protein MMC11_002792 [Xylographa trunciseda]|nr:hypothetical protein [Xylographa trunciseda]